MSKPGDESGRSGRGATRPGRPSGKAAPGPVEARPWRRKRKKAEGPLARKNARVRQEADAERAAKRRGKPTEAVPDAKPAGKGPARRPEAPAPKAGSERRRAPAAEPPAPRREGRTPATTAPRPAFEPSKAMLRDREAPVPDGPPRSGTVAIVGRSNVGKSTLLNAALEMPLAIVTPTPQTTRDALLGVVRHGTAEVGLLDTPGIFEAETALDRAMNRAADDAIDTADVVVFVTAVSKTATQNDDALRPHKRDLELLRALPAASKVVLAVNKIDLVRDKRRLLSLLSALGEARSFEAIVPISALREDGVRRVLDEVAKLLPEGEARFGEDDVTDRPARFFAREYVREQILLATHEEVPHAVAVTIDAWSDGAGGRATRVAATIHVERAGQKKILVGAGGSMLQRIGSSARARLAELVGGSVHLELFVRVTENWRNAPTKLGDMGYGPRAAGEGTGGGTVIEAVADEEDEDEDEHERQHEHDDLDGEDES